jgi:hypothetical protein
MKKIVTGLAAAVLAGGAGAASADSAITGTLAKLVAEPADAQGACPQTITFDGYLAIYGTFEPGHPVQFAMQFLKSDGAVGPVSYFTVSNIGKHTVSDTWTLGDAGQTNYSGWEVVKTWPTATPNGPGAVVSEKATFTLTCLPRIPHPAEPPHPPPGAVLNTGH